MQNQTKARMTDCHV